MDTNDFVNFHIILPRVASDKSLLSITRMLASDLISNPYLAVGEFFRNIPDADLQTLLEVVEEGDEGKHTQDLVILQQLLHSAEGLGQTFGSVDECVRRLQILSTFIVIASLHRKGLCEAIYNNFSFDESMLTAEIARPL